MNRKFFTPARARAIAAFFAVCAFYGVLLYLRPESAFPHVSAAGSVSTDSDLKIAFLADQGLGADAEAVLGIVKAEGAAAVVHAGDFDYAHSPSSFDSQVEKVLQSTIPYFGSVGNHDDGEWTTPNGGYAGVLAKRSGSFCTGERGVLATCRFRGLHILELGIGTKTGSNDPTQLNFIRAQFAQSDALWKICSWHQNQNAMQLGTKSDSIGWDAYEACREAGALIITGHEHTYSRTKTLTNISTQTVDQTCSTPTSSCIGPGKTIVIVSGLAGQGIRNQDRCAPTTYPYGCKQEWAKIYTSDQGASYGSLFLTFNYQGNPYRAHGVFKNINNQIVDEFDLTIEGSGAGGITPQPTNTVGSCANRTRGDADCDGFVRLSDYEIWRREYLTPGTVSSDFNNTSVVELADYQIWRTGYFAQTAAFESSSGLSGSYFAHVFNPDSAGWHH